ncbi:MAG: hypothetical protein QOG84_641 [Sphingomonadales bacterium]|jgi:hypothetical protein|nr:hypothetical protein [Sphingomonadales bacterium]
MRPGDMHDENDMVQQFRTWIGGRTGISPLYDEIVAGMIQDDEMLSLLAQISQIPYVCNRFMAAVHFLLLERDNSPLSQFYVTTGAPARSSKGVYDIFRLFCLSNSKLILMLSRSAEVQINEVRRSAAFVFALNSVRSVAGGTPTALIELGACAGLNLNLDRYQYDFGAGAVGPAQAGLVIPCEVRNRAAPPTIVIPQVVLREGIDVSPVDIGTAQGRNWLIAFASPDDHRRQMFLQQAMEICLRAPVSVRRGSAGELIGSVLASVAEGVEACVLHALTEHHFGALERAQVRRDLMEASHRRDVHVIGLEWPRTRGVVDMARELELTLTVYRQGKARRHLLAISDRRGAVDWLRPTG